MANEQFSLCWDNFHTNMSSGLSSLLKSEDLVDVTLAVDGRYIKAHKMILSVCSPYFKELFQVNPCKHPIVFLKDVSYVVISSLLEFMYQGEVKVSQDILGTFIKTAESLQIKGLTGDASSQSEAEPEAVSTPVHNNVPSTLPSDSSITLTRRSTREKTPPRKKMLGPLSKRFKPDTDYTHSPAETEQSTSETLQMEPQMANELVVAKNLPPLAPLTTFKLEPEETAVSLANEEDMTYDDSAMDDMGMDNTADYLMESHEDAKAGTSSEVANAEVPGENQDVLLYALNRSGRLSLIYKKNVFYQNVTRIGQALKWRCALRSKHRCCCSVLTTENGVFIQQINDHNHSKDVEKLKSKLETPEIYTRMDQQKEHLITARQRILALEYNLFDR